MRDSSIRKEWSRLISLVDAIAYLKAEMGSGITLGKLSGSILKEKNVGE
ncbi:MAG TPA: hypothetical protein PLH15_02015 [Spirochaetota bacterium]|nr:hypothetical protein [Spirochaetota bacterium]HQO21620.1 hypothetical protein [Spirochaetota bacterium]HQQ22600.1 hypothetical protein [Spirochaetota bacterium]